MANENETVEAIVKEMRVEFPPKYCSSKHCRVEVYQPVRSFADRIESAWRREKAELRLAIDAEKARHTDDYKDERIGAQDEEIKTLQSELKPRRNCDRFKNEDEADFHYRKEHKTAYAPAGDFIRWLFAPVAEEGGAK